MILPGLRRRILSGGIVDVGHIPTFRNSAQSGSNASSYSFNSKVVGSSDTYAIIGLAVAGISSLTFNSVSVTRNNSGGVTATKIAAYEGANPALAIFACALSGDTSIDVSVSLSASAQRAGFCHWSGDGLDITAAYDSGSDDTSPFNATGVVVPLGGTGFALGYNNRIGTPVSTAAWTTYTEAFDTPVETWACFSGAVKSGYDTNGPAVVFDGGDNSPRLLAASFEPSP